MKPFLSIVIPTYNGSRTIRDMLDTLIPQVTDEVEILALDNCSTDTTLDILKEYSYEYGVITCISNETNVGADGNFLKGMKLARGKYVMLISDDDIIIEGAISNIISFLKAHPDVTLAYLESLAFKDKYQGVAKCHGYKYLKPVEESFATCDKAEFLRYCQRLFGFTSSFVWSTERVRAIHNPERFTGTYFFQAYICIECSKKTSDSLGIVHGPCVAIGEYGIIGNYDVAEVEGKYYHRMLEYAVMNGYPNDMMNDFYLWKIIHLCRNNIIRERAIGVKMTSIKNLWDATYRYPKAWIVLYPFLLVPPFVCRFILKYLRKMQGRNFLTYVNRPTKKE